MLALRPRAGPRPLAAALLALLLGGPAAAEERPRPTPEQLRWQDWGVGVFIHFGPATWQDREFDDHSTPLSRINPRRLDAEQWARVAESMGARYLIFTAKHTGGFAMWQTRTTRYGIKETPYRGGKGDVVREIAEACRRHHLRFGIYLSPQDDNQGARPGGRCATPQAQARYDALYRRQLTELLTGYGPVAEVWLDGGLQTRVDDLLAQYAPDAVIFQSEWATVRWVGNEDGVAPESQMSTVATYAPGRDGYRVHLEDVGGRAWLPAEADARVRKDWFWSSTNAATLKSLPELLAMYEHTVGRNANLLLDFTPDTSGRIPEADEARAAELGRELDRQFGHPLAEGQGDGQVELALGSPVSVDRAVLMEEIALGERIHRWELLGWVGGRWQSLAQGLGLGHERIVRFAPTGVNKVLLRAEASGTALIRRLAVYRTLEEPVAAAPGEPPVEARPAAAPQGGGAASGSAP